MDNKTMMDVLLAVIVVWGIASPIVLWLTVKKPCEDCKASKQDHCNAPR